MNIDKENTMINNCKNTEDQRGSAILLTLGVLSLVLILAMSFAFSANTNLRIAKVQGATANARTLADDAVNLTIADMNFFFANTEYSDGNTVEGTYPAIELYDKKSTELKQDFMLFRSEEVAMKDCNARQGLMLSHNPNGLDEDDDYQAYEVNHLSSLFGLSKRTDKDYGKKDTYSNAAVDCYNPYETTTTSDAYCPEGTLFCLPQLRRLTDVLGDKVAFAPAITVDYKLYDENGNSKDVTQVVGRYAYIILEEGNKLDINTVTSTTGMCPLLVDDESDSKQFEFFDRVQTLYPISTSTNEPDFGNDTPWLELNFYRDFKIPNKFVYDTTDDVNSEKKVATIRLGVSMEEVREEKDYSEELPEGMNFNGAFGDVILVPWESYSQMSWKLKGTYLDYAPSAASTTDDGVFTYTFFSGEDIEAYWKWDSSTSTTGREMARFDLSGTSWGINGYEVDKNSWDADGGEEDSEDRQEYWCKLVRNVAGYDEDEDVKGAPSREPKEFWDDRVKEEVHHIEWATGDSADEKERKKNDYGRLDWLQRMRGINDSDRVGIQVAANLKDYSDADSYATTDAKLEPAEESTTATKKTFQEPHFCGNERAQYFNEVCLLSGSEPKEGFSATTLDGSENYRFVIASGVELLNLYCWHKSTDRTGSCNVIHDNKDINVTVRIKGKVKVYGQKYNWAVIGHKPAEEGGDEIREWRKDESEPVFLHYFDLKSEVGSGSEKDYVDLSLNDDNVFIIKKDDTDSLNSPLTSDNDKQDAARGHLGPSTFLLAKNFSLPDTIEGYEDLSDDKKKMLPSEKWDESQSYVDADPEKSHWYRYVFVLEPSEIIAFTNEKGKDGDVDKLFDVAYLPSADYANDKHLVDDINTADFGEEKTYKNKEFAFSGEMGMETFDLLNVVVDFQSADCRCNHRADTWQVRTNIDDGLFGGDMTLCDENEIDESDKSKLAMPDEDERDVEMNVNLFDETESKRVSYSTAYIANAPMKSLWELGAIHRGLPMQTINLKTYLDDKDDDGECNISYKDGDAGMLDQVKLYPANIVKGRYNVNSTNARAWRKLLEDIEISWYGVDPTNSDEFGSVPDNFGDNFKDGINEMNLIKWSELDTILKDMLDKKAVTRNRGKIADLLKEACIDHTNSKLTTAYKVGSGEDAKSYYFNDRELEMFIGKTAGLLTTRLDAYSMLLVAETLKELPDITDDDEFKAAYKTLINPVKVGKVNKYNESGSAKNEKDVYCSVTGRQKVLVHLIRDAWRNEFKIVHKQYLED